MRLLIAMSLVRTQYGAFLCLSYDFLYARMPEWSKGVDLRSTVERRAGSNPAPCITFFIFLYFYIFYIFTFFIFLHFLYFYLEKF